MFNTDKKARRIIEKIVEKLGGGDVYWSIEDVHLTHWSDEGTILGRNARDIQKLKYGGDKEVAELTYKIYKLAEALGYEYCSGDEWRKKKRGDN